MKHLVPLKPAPRPRSVRCACGRDEAVPHNCQYRRIHRPAPTSSQRSDSQSALTRLDVADDGPHPKQPRLTMGIPSRRRSRGMLTPVSPQRHLQLKGFPADVFHPEPFNAYPIATIGVVHRMTEHYLRVWAPQQGKPFAFEGHPNPYLSLVFPFALQNAVLFEGLIAMCRASWLLDHGEDYTTDRAFAYHHNNTKYALQKRLEAPATCADDCTLLTVAALATIDYTLGEHGMADQYLQSMRRMVQLRGGVMKDDSPWEKFLMIVVTAFEALWSFVLSNTPQHPSADKGKAAVSRPLRNEIPVYANHPFTPEFTLSLSKIPESLSNLAVKSILSVQIVRIIGAIPHKNFHASGDTSTVSTPAPQSSSPLMAHLTQSGSPDLHHVLTDLLRLSTLSTTKIEHLLVLGLVAYCLPLQYGVPLTLGNTVTLQQCVDGYMRHNFAEEGLDRGSVIWTSVVLAGAIDMNVDQDLASAPVLERALIRYPEARKWTSVETILKTFLWHDELAPLWKMTWEKAMNRKKTTPPSSADSTPSPGGASGGGGGGKSSPPRQSQPQARSGISLQDILHND